MGLARTRVVFSERCDARTATRAAGLDRGRPMTLCSRDQRMSQCHCSLICLQTRVVSSSECKDPPIAGQVSGPVSFSLGAPSDTLW